MKIQYLVSLSVILALALLSACDHNIKMESVVHEDGSIDRTIILSGDSSLLTENMFDATGQKGWKTSVTALPTDKDSKKTNYDVTFVKHFNSVEEANQETDADNDSLFRVKSTFEKRFRWFYTYLRYSDTYGTLNWFQLPSKDYFTNEDYAFINRLPSESARLSRADSLYLKRLEDKLTDIYAGRAYYEEAFTMMYSALKAFNTEKKWLDTLARNKEKIYKKLIDSNVDDNKLMQAVMDTLDIPVPAGAVAKYNESAKALEKKMKFMTDAYSGKYMHIIRMPWPVVETNADSVVAGGLFWKPRVTKFMLNGFEMYAESRKMNYWAILVSVMVVVGSGWVLLRRKK